MPAKPGIPLKRPQINLKKILISIFSAVARLNVTQILVVLLITAAFLIGVLFTKVSYLEKGITNSGTTTQVGDNTGNAPSAPTGPVDVSAGHLPVLGNKDAKVTLVEFSDFQCPFCKSMFDESLPQIKKDYIDTGKVKLAYRHFPLTSIHPNAQKAAEASECANDQGKFWQYHDELFKNQTEWESLSPDKALEKFAEYAGNIGIDSNKLSGCVSSGQFEDNVNKDLDEGSTAGVQGTPATYVNGYLLEGAVPYEQFKAEIEKRLAE